MKIQNPFYVDPIATYALSVKAAFASYLTTNKALETIDFDKIRADFPAEASKLTDGVIAEICQILGVKISE